MKSGILPLTFLAFCGTSLLQAESTLDLSLFSHQSEITTPNPAEGLGTFPLDAEVFRVADDQLGDLRLTHERDGKMIPVPFLIERMTLPTPARGSVTVPSSTKSFTEQDDGSIEIILERENGADTPGRLHIETPLRNFEKQVDVSGSNDGESWKELVRGEMLFDHERFLDFRRTGLSLPESDFRFFRVRIAEATDRQRSLMRSLRKTVSESSGLTMEEAVTETERNFRIDRISLHTKERKIEERLSMMPYPTTILRREEDQEQKRTELILDIGNCPVDLLRFETEDRNFRRQVEIQVPARVAANGTVERWRSLHKGTIHRYRIGEFSDEELSLTFPPPALTNRVGQVRIFISNGDSAPIEIRNIRAFGEVYELQFLAVPEGTYRLFLGGGEVDKPSYDLSAIRVAGREKVPTVSFTAGPLMENTAFSGPSRSNPLLNQTWFLWLAIAAVVACLVIVLMRAAGSMEDAVENSARTESDSE